MRGDSWLQVCGSAHTHTRARTNEYMRNFSSLQTVLKQGKSKRETSGAGGETNKCVSESRPPSRTSERPASGRHSLLPLSGTYSRGASADHSKWAVKCYSMLNTLLSPACVHTHTHAHSTHIRDNTQLLQLMKEELKICGKIWKWEFKKKLSLQRVFAFVLETHIVRFSGFSFIIHIIFYFIIYSSAIKSFFN